MNNKNFDNHCDVCGALTRISVHKKICDFCKFVKALDKSTDKNNQNIIFADNINQFFKDKYAELNHGETFILSLPVSGFYKKPVPKKGQVNFFKSKNIMFLLEQHGFQMVSRKSRFSSQLSMVVRKV
jgi:glutaredoxin